MEKNIAAILRHLGEDPARAGLLATPRRVRESLEYLTSGNPGLTVAFGLAIWSAREAA